MNWKKIFTIAALTGFSASVATGQGTAPTIIQGDYISNVFGQSNFIKNPNAKLNTKDVTVSNATVSRSISTPLVATSEFIVAITSANGTATWATRAFDAGMKGQNCEARFTYRGFAATSKVHIKQGANTVASLNLTPATDPRIASINFPCGDLSTATTFVVTDTAILAGTNEIGGIYTGLATNQANVAQAESVVQAWRGGSQTISSGGSPTTVIFNAEGLDAYGEMDTVTGIFTAKRAGNYLVNYQLGTDFLTWDAGEYLEGTLFRNSTEIQRNYQLVDATQSKRLWVQGQQTVTLAVGDTLKVNVFQNRGLNVDLIGQRDFTSFNISRFPTSSELVVTPERQNTFAAGQWTGSASFGRTNTTEITISNANFATNRTAFGKAEFTTTANDLAIKVPQMPPGTYRIELTGNFSHYLNQAGPLDSNCSFFLKDGTNTAVGRSQQYGPQFTKDSISTATAIVKYTSTADRTFTASLASGIAVTTECVVQEPKIIITPLDQPSNSALYVQGPVLGAQTGAAIPEGYVNEFSTRSISDTSLRQQSSPVLGTFYYPWTSTLTLPAGNWMLCYKAMMEVNQTSSSGNVAYVKMHIQNQTDSTEVMTHASLGQLLQAPYFLEYLWVPFSQCKPIAITSSKTFRMGIGYGNNTGIASVNTVKIRGDLSQTELYAIRLN